MATNKKTMQAKKKPAVKATKSAPVKKAAVKKVTQPAKQKQVEEVARSHHLQHLPHH